MSLVNFVGGAIGLYRVVPPDEAHVRVMFDKKELFWSRVVMDKDGKTPSDEQPKHSYWVVPFVTQVSKLPLTNIRIDIGDVKLNDSNMAKFQCDIVCFVTIKDPVLAAERTGITVETSRFEGHVTGIEDLAKDFSAIMESIGRTVATKQTILDIYKDRQKLDEAVTKEVQTVFPRWGLELVDLEIRDLKDVPGSTIIQDIEKKQAATISADARVQVASENRRAAVAEAAATKESEVAKAEAEQEYRTKQIEAQQNIQTKQADANKAVAERQAIANQSTVDAESKLTVGRAEIEKKKIEQEADAAKIKRLREADAEAAYTLQTKTAEAEGITKVAEAQQKYKDAAMQLEVVKAIKEVNLAYADANGKIAEKANITILTDQNVDLVRNGLAGSVNVGPRSAFALASLLKANPELAKRLEGFDFTSLSGLLDDANNAKKSK